MTAMNDKKQINDGGPAFPGPSDYKQDGSPVWMGVTGMTLRDWFAGNEKIDENEEYAWELLEALVGPRPEGDRRTNPIEWFVWTNNWQAAVRYGRADAMIAAREKGGE